MSEVSVLRLYLLRALYLLVVVGLGIVVWPGIIHHTEWELMEGVVQCMLAAFPSPSSASDILYRCFPCSYGRCFGR